jgi:hypothetical protein
LSAECGVFIIVPMLRGGRNRLPFYAGHEAETSRERVRVWVYRANLSKRMTILASARNMVTTKGSTDDSTTKLCTWILVRG